ncbi:hypothetical protein A7K91_14165 [Paenibacillus oryzae]|uniref:Uncharacterized protein n=1 Tax=Paenibacillus oryzae TaxID=1844972 RepID=A0A1A5YJG9_9BACL|nr:hypothetical protein [Paenibacillus oryzae]OBR65708.1 hypothetical protein A7K91_14165 [Paenibacillus oryzae]
MPDTNGLSDLFKRNGINGAIVIDDQVENKVNDIVLKILEDESSYHTEEFDLREELEKQTGYTLKEAIDMVVDDEDIESIIQFLQGVTSFKDKFQQDISLFTELLNDIFGSDNVIIKKSVDSNFKFENDKILFLDYRLEGSPLDSENYSKCIEKFSDEVVKNPWSIVFMSTNKTFSVQKEGEELFLDMLKPLEKSKYFSLLRKEADYKNCLYDFIHKSKFLQKDSIINELTHVLQNFIGGKMFYSLLEEVKDIIHTSSNEVLNRFRLLNARSLNEIISRKVSKEGESNPTFLLNWIVGRVAKDALRVDSNWEKVNDGLEQINKWSSIFHELHEDFEIRKIATEDMWDQGVNGRHAPVDFGDVFEIEYEDKILRAILLTQTCTLAIRGSGDRSGQLAQLAVQNDEKKGRVSGVPIQCWDFDEITFDLDDNISFPMDVLDLVSLNKDGKAGFALGENLVKQIPNNRNWSSGYSKRIVSLVNSLAKDVEVRLESNESIIELNRVWVPFEVLTEDDNKVVRFKIKRIARLENQYALNILQISQSWSGRIGLPMSVNFMDDYVKEPGKLSIHGHEFDCSFYTKFDKETRTEVAVDISSLRQSVLSLYKGCANYDTIEELMFRNELTTLHYASSGLELLSLTTIPTYTDQFLQKNNIRFNFDKNLLLLQVTLGHFSNIILVDEDIPPQIGTVRITAQDITFNISKEDVEGYPTIKEKVLTIKNKENRLYYIITSQHPDMNFEIQGTKLFIRPKLGEEEAAAAKQ